MSFDKLLFEIEQSSGNSDLSLDGDAIANTIKIKKKGFNSSGALLDNVNPWLFTSAVIKVQDLADDTDATTATVDTTTDRQVEF